MTFDKRIKLGLALVLISAIAITIMAIFGMGLLSSQHNAAVKLHEKEEYFNSINMALQDVTIAATNYLLNKNESTKNEFSESEKKEEALFKKKKHYQINPEQNKTLTEISNVHEELEEALDKVFENKMDPAILAKKVNSSLIRELGSLEVKLDKLMHDEMKDLEKNSQKKKTIYYLGITFLLIATVIVGSGSAYYLTGNVVSPLMELTEHLEGAAVKIFSSSEQQASGASEQAASVAETTATVEELNQTSVQIAESAQAVADVSEKTLQSAKKGEESVNSTMDALSNIESKTVDTTDNISSLEEKSKAINQILEIINDIAEQTNLLALNAAIEAARAGEAGKGFQVVASEIKKLAESVVNSTNDIKDIISELNDLVKKAVVSTGQVKVEVSKGVSLSKAGKERLQKIVQLVEEATNSAKQISIATRQQQTASKQVVVAMKEVAEVAKQSADASKENTTSIQKLADLTKNLKTFIGQKRLDIKTKSVAG